MRTGYVLAKIQMVTKRNRIYLLCATSYVLAKIQMVTKPIMPPPFYV